MGVEIHRLAGRLMRQFRKRHPNADPYVFRDEVERVFHQALTRRIAKKRRGILEVTKAVGMWRRQLAEIRRGQRKAVTWRPIALACIPGFSLMSDSERKRSLRRLSNSVYNRIRRAAKRARGKAGERPKALVGSKTE